MPPRDSHQDLVAHGGAPRPSRAPRRRTGAEACQPVTTPRESPYGPWCVTISPPMCSSTSAGTTSRRCRARWRSPPHLLGRAGNLDLGAHRDGGSRDARAGVGGDRHRARHRVLVRARGGRRARRRRDRHAPRPVRRLARRGDRLGAPAPLRLRGARLGGRRAPPWATEILVEARSGGTCLVRLVSGVFSGGEDWGDEIDGTEAGWALGMENLRLYLTHFAGRRCSHALAVGVGGEPSSARGPPSPPRSAWTGRSRARASTARWSAASSSACSTRWCCCATTTGSSRSTRTRATASTHLAVRAYRFGDGRRAVAAREEPAWRAWMDEHVSAAV